MKISEVIAAGLAVLFVLIVSMCILAMFFFFYNCYLRNSGLFSMLGSWD